MIKSRLRLCAFMVLGILVDAGLVWSAESPIPTMKCPTTMFPIRVDGIVESVWAKCPPHTLVNNTGPEVGAQPTLRSSARVIRDNTYLYILFIFEDNDITSAFVDNDTMLWSSGNRTDIADFIVQPGTDSTSYYEFVVNPEGAVLDSLVKWQDGKPTWDISSPGKHPFVAARRVAVHRDHLNGWTVEVAIPFNILGAVPNKGDVWRANFHRADSDMTAHLAWSPTYRNTYHRPERFGRLLF